MSDEMRAFNNLRWYRATGDAPHSLIGLNGYGPNLNIARDPRYGRISELPGEDAFLSGTYVLAYHGKPKLCAVAASHCWPVLATPTIIHGCCNCVDGHSLPTTTRHCYPHW